MVIMRNIFHLFLFCVTAMCLTHVEAYGATGDVDEKDRLAREITNLRATDAALQRNDAQFRKLRKQEQTTHTDITEFAEFVATLKRQVIESCEAVRGLGGDPTQYSADCIKLEEAASNGKGLKGDASGDAGDTEREHTREEKAASLANQMNKLESELDEILLNHQDKIKEKKGISKSLESRTAGTGDRTTAETGADADETDDGEEAKSTAKHEKIPPKGESGAGQGIKKEGAVPEHKTEAVADASDDDVIARQLREAAEAETDPLLKEQLWKEYEKYKESIR